MEVKVLGNIVQVKTGIPASWAKKELSVTDKDNNKLYEITVGNSYISKFGIGTTVINDELVATIDAGTADIEEIKDKYGLALIAAKAYIPVIENGVTTEKAMVDDIFAEALGETAPVEDAE